MEELAFSFVIPVYNRPEEIQELLESLKHQDFSKPFEVVIVEDGSVRSSGEVVESYRDSLQISYWTKPNTGPGDSRNFGMKKASGNYFILVDSDCILPPDYLREADKELSSAFLDCFGGPDDAHPSFNPFQKAISFCMTSLLTTGGIRGSRKAQKNFQPRSFNMGLSREAFLASGGFGSIHPGEDPDLSLRLKKKGFSLGYLPSVRVYHKRRITFSSFYKQVHKFGLTRPILNRWHPGSSKLTYWFPVFFSAGVLFSVILPVIWNHPLAFYPLLAVLGYLFLVGLAASWKNKSVYIGLLAITALLVQFFGYGYGFLKSTVLLTFSKRKAEELFPNLFFNV